MSDSRVHEATHGEGGPAGGAPGAPRFHALAGAAIVLACVLAYGATLDHEFVFDDEPRIERNPAIQIDAPTPDQLHRVVRSAGNRPVAYLSFALNHWLGGLDVTGFRVVNLSVHAINGLLVYAIALFLLGGRAGPPPAWARTASRPAALGAALVFTLHPVQIQAVTYVVQRITSLAVLFGLLSFLLFLLGRVRVGRGRALCFAGSLLAWVLGLATKEITACLPALVLLAEWFFFRDLDRRWLGRQLPWLALGGAPLGVLAFVYLGGDFSLPGYARRDFSLGERLLTQPRVVLFYLGLVLLPHPSRLSLHHVFETSRSLTDPPATLAALVGVVVLVAGALLLAPRARLAAFGGLWFFVALAIESSFIPLEMAFEHRIYLPLVGLSILLGGLLARGLSRRPAATLAAGLAVVALLGLATFERNRAWQTRVSLWSDVARKNPDDARALFNLGRALTREGRAAEALPHLEAALGLVPDYFRCRVALGLALAELGDHEAAIAHYEAALRTDPEHVERWTAQTNIGVSLQRLGRLQEAEASYRRALASAPQATATRTLLAGLLEATGREEAARGEYEAILEAEPRHAEALAALGYLLGRQGELALAARRFEALIRLRPDDPRGHAGLGLTLATQGRLAEAEPHLREALRLSPDDPGARDALDQIRRVRRARGPSPEPSPAR